MARPILDAESLGLPDELKAEMPNSHGVQESQEVIADPQELRDRARVDMNLLCNLCMPDMFKFRFPVRYLAIWQWLLEHADVPRTFYKLALGIPRGFSKTTVIKLFILWLIFFSSRKYILIFGATPQNAINALRDIETALDNPNVQAVFGNWRKDLSTDTQIDKRFSFRGRIIKIQARGAMGDIRGVNIDNERPDVIIFDDIQKREEASSEVLSTALRDWMQNTAMKLNSPFGCIYLFLGNMYPYEGSLMKWLMKQRAWLKVITGAILADGTSLWEDLFPIKQLLEEYLNDVEAGMRYSFMAERMNDPNATVSDALDITKIAPWENTYNIAPEAKFIVLDPARGNEGNDAVAIGAFNVFDKKPVLYALRMGAFPPKECIRETLDMCAELDIRYVFVEAVAYQATLLYWFNEVCQQLKITNIEFVPVYPGHSSKNSRIVVMFREWLAGEVAVAPACWTHALSQAVAFDHRRKNNTDEVLDLLHYAPKIVAEYGEILARQTLESINNVLQINASKQLTAIELSPF